MDRNRFNLPPPIQPPPAQHSLTQNPRASSYNTRYLYPSNSLNAVNGPQVFSPSNYGQVDPMVRAPPRFIGQPDAGLPPPPQLPQYPRFPSAFPSQDPSAQSLPPPNFSHPPPFQTPHLQQPTVPRFPSFDNSQNHIPSTFAPHNFQNIQKSNSPAMVYDPTLNCNPSTTSRQSNSTLPSASPVISSNSSVDPQLAWLESWCRTKQNGKINGSASRKPKGETISLGDFRILMKEVIESTSKLSSVIACHEQDPDVCTCGMASEFQSNQPQDGSDQPDEDEHHAMHRRAVEILQDRVKQIRMAITDDMVSQVREKMKRVTSKRKRLRRKKCDLIASKQQALEKREEREREIDKWQGAIWSAEQAVKKKRELEKAADETLGEVRRKLLEARRSMKLLAFLQKLRSLKKEKESRQGNFVDPLAEDAFKDRMASLTKVMKQQITMYESEELTLKVMLDTEQEANMEREEKIRKKKDVEKWEDYEKSLRTCLFGKEENILPTDPIAPFRQYYDVGTYNLDALYRIRQEWDRYTVPSTVPGGSCLPIGWVVPVEPSSKEWESALCD